MPHAQNKKLGERMILRRMGNKKRMAKKILPLFPEHSTYVELFFGAGGLFFQKDQAGIKYNIVNDNDSDVFNLYWCLLNRKEELVRKLNFPIHSKLFHHWRTNIPIDPVMRAVRFLFLSNWGFAGKPNTPKLGEDNTKKIILANIEETFDRLKHVQFVSQDFREVLKKVSIRNWSKVFVYADPPYLNTANNYQSGFNETDSLDLFNLLESLGCKWAMSEFDHPFIVKQAIDRGLIVTELGERRNLSNRRMELLITNYDPEKEGKVCCLSKAA